MAEHGKGNNGGGNADKGKGPVAKFARPIIVYDLRLVRQALLSIANLPYHNDARIEIRSSDADTNLVPVVNPVQFWTICNGCNSLVKCEMICRNDFTSTRCPHQYYSLLTSDKADLPDIYRCINRSAYEQQCLQLRAAKSNPFNNGSNPNAALNSQHGSMAGLGSSNSTISNSNGKMASVVQTYNILKQKVSEPFVQRFNPIFPGETPEDFGSLPSPKEIYEHAVADWNYFYQTLICLTNVERRNLQIPSIDGQPLNLYRIFIEVTSRGGIQKVMEDDRLKEVCANLPQKIDEYYLFATYMAQLDFYEHVIFRIPNDNRINLSLLSSGERPLQGGIGMPITSQQFVPPVMPMPDQRSAEPSFHEAQALAQAQAQTQAQALAQAQAQAQVAIKRQKLTTRLISAQQSSPRLVPLKRLAQQASAPPKAPVVTSQQKSRANYTASKQLNVTPYVPAPSSSAEHVSLQREVRPVATEAQAASIQQQQEANFFQAPNRSLFAIPGSAYRQSNPQMNSAATMETTISNIEPGAPKPSSYTTQVSAQTVSKTTQTLLEARVSAMQTTDSRPTEYPSDSPLLNKRMISPAESKGDNIHLGEKEVISEQQFNMKLTADHQDNQMKADETRAGAKDNSDGFGSQNGKGHKKIE